MLAINILSFTAHAYIVNEGQGLTGLYLATGLLCFFIIDYLSFEEVHLYTYDFFAERVGFKLGWGCIAFYPFFYSIPIWVAAESGPVNTPGYLQVFYTVIFFLSWTLSRGANLQKYYFKKNPAQSFLGIRPQVITDGHKTLLVSGFWGLSRHINYLGEIGMAVAIVLAAGHPENILSWLYPLYYVALLFPRQADDDRRCARKYGELWQQYLKRVPYRIIPYLY
jgi:delta14-sterol reductase